MVESPEYRNSDDISVASIACWLIRNALPQALVRPSLVEVSGVLASDAVEISRAQQHQVIERLAPKAECAGQVRARHNGSALEADR
jgi:hypothetical protein